MTKLWRDISFIGISWRLNNDSWNKSPLENVLSWRERDTCAQRGKAEEERGAGRGRKISLYPLIIPTIVIQMLMLIIVSPFSASFLRNFPYGETHRNFNSLFGSANSLRAKTIMRLFDSKWIVEKRFSDFLADVAPGNSLKTFWARVCRYTLKWTYHTGVPNAPDRNWMAASVIPQRSCYREMITHDNVWPENPIVLFGETRRDFFLQWLEL